MVNTDLVSEINTSSVSALIYSSKKSRSSGESDKTAPKTSITKDEIGSFSLIRESVKNSNLPQDTIDIICASWRDSTKVQYRHYQKR